MPTILIRVDGVYADTTYTWDGPAGGAYSDSSWNAGSGDVAPPAGSTLYVPAGATLTNPAGDIDLSSGSANGANLYLSGSLTVGSSGSYGMVVDGGGFLQVNSSGTLNSAALLTVGQSANQSASAEIDGVANIGGGPSDTTSTLTVGNAGSGTINEGVQGTSADVTVPNVVLGAQSGSNGVYTIDSGTLNATSSITMTSNKSSNSGNVFNINGGTVTTATFTENGGSLNQSGGTNSVTGSITVSGGNYTQSSGLATFGSASFANAASFSFTGGAMTINGGTFNPFTPGTYVYEGVTETYSNSWAISGASAPVLTLENGANSSNPSDQFVLIGTGSNTGTVNVSGAGTTLSVQTSVDVGYGGVGYLNLSNNAQVSGSQYLIVGNIDGVGSITIQSGASLSTSSEDVVGSYGIGSVGQSGGTDSTQTLYIGFSSVSTGSYSLSGTGSLAVSANEYVAYAGIGTFNQSGGTNSVTSSFYEGFFNGSSGSYTLSDTGNLNAATEYIGFYQGVGTFNQSGGTNTATGAVTIASSSTYLLSGGVLRAGSLSVSSGGTFNWTGGTLMLSGSTSGITSWTVPNGGTLSGHATVNAATTVAGGGTISPGDPAIQTYSAGLQLSGGGTYDWELASPPSTSGAGTSFDQVQVTGGNLALGGSSNFKVDLSLLSAGNQPGGSNNNSFWNSSHLWQVMTVTGSGTNTGGTNFDSITNGEYATGDFATQLDADGKSVDLVYNEMNLTAGAANNTVLGKITLSGSNGNYLPGMLLAGDVASGSIDISGLNPPSDSPLLVLMDVKGTTSAIAQWFNELSGAQTGGPQGYAVEEVGPGHASVPSWASIPAGDTGFLFDFSNVSGSGDRYLNFDWSAGNSGVTLDEVAVVPEPTAVGMALMAGATMLMKRRRKRAIN